MNNKLSYQAVKSIDSYYNDLPFKGTDFMVEKDIMFFIIHLEIYKWAIDYNLAQSFQEDLRSNIEHYIQLHPNVALNNFVTNESYKNVNKPSSNATWKRVFDELGYDNITHNTL